MNALVYETSVTRCTGWCYVLYTVLQNDICISVQCMCTLPYTRWCTQTPLYEASYTCISMNINYRVVMAVYNYIIYQHFILYICTLFCIPYCWVHRIYVYTIYIRIHRFIYYNVEYIIYHILMCTPLHILFS